MEVDRWWSGGHTEEDQWLRWFNGMVWRRFGDGDLAMATWRSVQERNGARVILFGVRVFFSATTWRTCLEYVCLFGVEYPIEA